MVGQPTQNTSSPSPCQPVSSSTMNKVPSETASASSAQQNSAATAASPQAESPKRCVWCREVKTLKFVLPTQHGRKEVCTPNCLVQFKMAYKQGNVSLCKTCGCAARDPRTLTHNNKQETFCTPECESSFKTREGIKTPPQKQPLPPATKKKQHDPNTDQFRWTDYLQKTASKPAPPRCFKQTTDPPQNEFANDMKLEAIDPRNTTSTCIATVIGSVGPRIRLRLDGSDNSNDFWRMVDSDEIQPIGTCEGKGGMLQPPLGFQKNASFWPMFLCKTLNGAQMAPAHCFKREPATPRFNLFKVGEKLEAVDRKNPHLICVATVGAVDRDNIHVTFDGWRGAFDYWCKYDSREIFPVGWCEKAGHPLQPPGNKAPLHTPPPSTLTPQPQISNHHSPPTSPQPQIPPYVVILHVYTTCDCGPYLDPAKLRCVPTIIGPSNIQEVYNQFIQLLRQCALKSAPLSTLLPVQGSDLLEQGDFWNEILGLIERFKFCENFVSDKPEDEEEVGRRVRECVKCGGGRNGEVRKKRKSSGASRGSVDGEKKLKGEVKEKLDPGDWGVEEVIGAICNVDSSMVAHSELFRKHEIDGKAMLLLNSDMMMKYMGLKLGPALKICNIISKFKSKNIKNGSNGV